MQLLDASLAFVLTLAALATVVTTIMEVCLRMARMRKKNLIKVMQLLNGSWEKVHSNSALRNVGHFLPKYLKIRQKALAW
ncbi:hypothetical protein [uncultured Desulfobacter sp.]|uniref:hypothetical protein n=1 Tax=uncultured Desulfobacter sp. TaxID=240139 RepID=UPI002AAAB475|nr:hypothetical protein [uncultured Desulfobacter sp.]